MLLSKTSAQKGGARGRCDRLVMVSFPKEKLALALFLVSVPLVIQSVAIQRPFSGHYASYQATVMASIARNMVRENFSELLLPKTDSLIGGKRSLHLNQYPFPALVAALGVKFLGGSFEFWGRFQAIFFNFLSGICLGLIAWRLFGSSVGWASVAIYALSPYTLIYGQSFMSEAMALFFLLFSFYEFCKFLDTGRKGQDMLHLVLSALSFSVSVTGRIHLLLFCPVYWLALIYAGRERRWLSFILFSVVAFAMPAAWYAHTYFSSLNSEHVHTSIFIQLSTPQLRKESLLLKPDYYRNVFDTLSQTMLTPLLFPFVFVGLYLMNKRNKGFWLTAGAIAFGSLVVILAPEKLMRHDFYLYGVFPFLAVVTGCGLVFTSEASPTLRSRPIVITGLILYVLVSARFFVHPIFKQTGEASHILKVAREVQVKTQPEDRVVVAGQSPAVMLYYVNRPAWPLQFDLLGKPVAPYLKNPRLGQKRLDEMKQLEEAMKDPVSWLQWLRAEGASYLVAQIKGELESVPDLLAYLKKNCDLLSTETDDFYVFGLIPQKTDR